MNQLFVHHSVENKNNEIIITLHIDKHFGYEEFSQEYFSKGKEWLLEHEARKYIQNHFPNFKRGIVKIAFGTMVLTSIPVIASAEEIDAQQEAMIEHVVEKGDTLYSIASRYNVTTDEIKSANDLTSDMIAINQKLMIPTADFSNTGTESSTNTTKDIQEKTSADEVTTYTVQSGDSLFKIAQKFNTTIDQLKDINALTSDTIFVGQVLTLPSKDKAQLESPTKENIEVTAPNIKETVEPSETASDPIYKEGMRDKEIVELKKALNKIGFGGISVTDYYGSFTTRRIKEFQSYYDLEATGIADKKTMDKIYEVANSPYQFGKRHPDMIEIKEALNELGFGKITVTTYYGSYTVKKVKEFQEHVGLKANGIIDGKTLEKIKEVREAPLRLGVRRPDVIELKKHLNAIGYGGILETDYFGSFTAKRVKEFQTDFHLTPTGVADRATLDKVKEIASSPHQLGIRDKKNIPLKEKLNKIGFGRIAVTNYYGSFTKKQVKAFQRYYNLPETGIAENMTLAKIDEIVSSPLQLGKRSDELIPLKEKLNQIGYGNITVTTYFGSFTEKKLKEFQKDYNLPISGIADEKTLEKLDEVVNQPLKKGMRRPDIVELKKKLDKAGFGGITLTTYFGSFTEKQVKAFQKKYNLKVDGVVDKATMEKLDDVIRTTIPSPFDRVMEPQSSGEDVRLLQIYLKDIGFKVVDQPTTFYGTLTESKVKDFQKQNGLPQTGIADGRTLQLLVSQREQAVENIESFTITGKGYGHSVGMTQWGAYGMAKEGFTYEQILKHYYTGVEIGSRDTSSQIVRVLLANDVSEIKVKSNQLYQVGDVEFAPNTETIITLKNGEFLIKNNNKSYTRKAPFQITSSKDGLLSFNDKQYEGAFFISSTSKGKLDLVNHLNVESYLKGVVPYEIIPSWNNTDLYKAQTLAARTYVLKEIPRYRNRNFDVYDTTQSQVYNGVPTNIPAKYVEKINQAIQETNGQVILYNGTLIDAVYSASAGGHTVDAVDVWGNNIPYLVGVEDKYDTSHYSTYWWSYSITKKELQELYPDVGKVVNVTILETKYNRPTKIKISGEKKDITVSGTQFRAKLGYDNIRSATFMIEGK